MVARKVESKPADEVVVPHPWYPPHGAKGDDWIHPQLRQHAVDIDTLTLDPANARTHGRKNLDAITGSLSKFGQRQLLVVQRQGMVVRAGNGRLVAMREMRWTRVAVLVVDEGDVSAAAFALTDNRTSELAEWDDDALASVVRAITGEQFPLVELGWGEKEILALLADPDAGAGDPNPDPGADPGDDPDAGGDGGDAGSIINVSQRQKRWIDTAVAKVRESKKKTTIGAALEHVCRIFLGEEGS